MHNQSTYLFVFSLWRETLCVCVCEWCVLLCIWCMYIYPSMRAYVSECVVFGLIKYKIEWAFCLDLFNCLIVVSHLLPLLSFRCVCLGGIILQVRRGKNWADHYNKTLLSPLWCTWTCRMCWILLHQNTTTRTTTWQHNTCTNIQIWQQYSHYHQNKPQKYHSVLQYNECTWQEKLPLLTHHFFYPATSDNPRLGDEGISAIITALNTNTQLSSLKFLNFEWVQCNVCGCFKSVIFECVCGWYSVQMSHPISLSIQSNSITVHPVQLLYMNAIQCFFYISNPATLQSIH